ncbi:MAG: tRNA (cytidine(34)-2'-O)-methyltransferase, partial [Clostridia bacterium]|nr:tRNA (cytidine(34)-2'-O)-methyltransferase [Clostridia bacterium]
CAATGARLHLIKPLGFSIDDKSLKRAGLDYWHLLDITVYENLQDFFEKNKLNVLYDGIHNADGQTAWFLSTKAQRRYDEVEFSDGDYLFFGKETKGLPEDLLHDNYQNTLRIPMIEGARSLNLSNSVAIVCYEALRQLGFDGLLDKGHLTKY